MIQVFPQQPDPTRFQAKQFRCLGQNNLKRLFNFKRAVQRLSNCIEQAQLTIALAKLVDRTNAHVKIVVESYSDTKKCGILPLWWTKRYDRAFTTEEQMGKQYSRESKIETVRLSYQTDKKPDDFAASVGISRSSLNRWRSEYGQDPQQAFPGKGVRKERDEEVAQLKKQLRDAQLENEVLKKAVAIFTQPKR